VIKNKKNKREAIVGNVCVKKFLGLPSDLIFKAIQRIIDDISNALNGDAILHAYDRGWINEWEKNFYLDTKRKRKLSQNQMQKRIQINEKVLRYTINKFKGRQIT
jgi:hypothetical protein